MTSKPGGRTTGAPSHLKVPGRLYPAYIFDLDGTIYLGEGLLPGAKRLIEMLRERSIPVRFLSNNPTKDPEQYVEKLTRLGLPTPVDDIVNTVVTMTRWLLEHAPGQVVFPLGDPPLIRAFEKAGIPMSEDPAEIDIVVASYDHGFDYRKLQIAFDSLWFHRRARFVATHPDRYCPFPGGRGEPDVAAVIAAIEACTGVRCEQHVGKPDPEMLALALADLDLDPSEVIMTGDRLSTDVRLARNAGAAGALVLTGDSDLDDLAGTAPEHAPHYVLDRIDQLIPSALWEQLGWEVDDT